MANIEFTFRCPDCVPVYPSGLEEKVIFGSSTGMEVVITGTNTRSCEREREGERESPGHVRRVGWIWRQRRCWRKGALKALFCRGALLCPSINMTMSSYICFIHKSALIHSIHLFRINYKETRVLITYDKAHLGQIVSRFYNFIFRVFNKYRLNQNQFCH